MRWSYLFLITAIIAAVYGFGKVPDGLRTAGQIVFYLFSGLTILTLTITAFKIQHPINHLVKPDTIMNELNIKGNLKQKFAELTDNDLRYAEGKEEELVGRVQQRLGTSKQEAQNIIQKA